MRVLSSDWMAAVGSVDITKLIAHSLSALTFPLSQAQISVLDIIRKEGGEQVSGA
jgi:hypothetical protein